MAETPSPDPGSPDAALDRQSHVIATFEDAWKHALPAGRPPDLNAFLAQVAPSDRPRVATQLARIDSHYRGQHTPAADPNAASQVPPGTRETTHQSLDATVQLESSSGDESSSISSDSDSVPAGPAATIELAAGKTSADEPACTIDPVGAAAESDLSLSFDPAVKSRKQKKSPLADGAKVPGYEILGELGRGGMGVVYRAQQRSLKRQVALKMILAGGHAGSDQIDRFRAEAEAVAQLQHPNIVQIYEVGEQAGLPFFSLEFVDGHSLDAEIDRQPQLPIRAAEIVEQLAHAMHYAHTQGIVHRDLKPANILLTIDGVPKITDFGLVKRIESDSSQTRTGTIMGTPSYMAPEQGRGEKDVGPLADVYALGSILYTMLTGRPPFMGPTAMDTLMQVLKTEPVPPSRLQPKIPRDIEIICLKCLQKEPQKRYESAGMLAADLRRFRGGLPILARRIGSAERLWRWCRRNPRVAALSAAAALLALALMIGGPAAALLVNEQRKLAVEAEGIAEQNAQAARKSQHEAQIAEKAAVEARKIADENANIASQQRQLALDTLNRVVTQVEEELHDRSELNELRQTVLNLAMEGLDNVSRTSENAILADRMIGAAHQRMADILFHAGKIDEARTQYGKGLAIFEQLLDPKIPENDLARWNAALTCDGLGDVSRKQMEDANIARDYYDRALEHRKILQTIKTSEKLKPVMVRASLANSYGRLSLLQLELTCDPQKAAQLSEQAVEQGVALRKDLSDNPVALQLLAGAWNLHAEAMLHQGKTEEALKFAEQAFELRRKYFSDNPQSVKARQDLAVSNWLLGDFALVNGDLANTLEHYQAAHDFRMQLYESDRNNPEMWEDLSNSFYRLGTIYLLVKQPAEALRCFDECLTHRQNVLNGDPENISKQLQFLLVQARCGQVTEAAQRADELREKLFPNPGTLLRLAGIYALCGAVDGSGSAAESGSATSAQANRQKALELLKLAREHGFRDAVALTLHPDLSSLRSETTFSQIVAQVASAASAP
jgi:eukaryotic-like serine/threonine-protein kinase